MLNEQWHKSSRSGAAGHCVEARYVKASRSNGNGGNNCVEVAFAKATQSALQSNCVEVGFTSASISNVTCVEVGFTSASATNMTCVEIATPRTGEDGSCGCSDAVVDGVRIPGARDLVLVRDSKNKTGDGLVVAFTREQWKAFCARVLEYGIDWPEQDGRWWLITDPAGDGGKVLRFDLGEWTAFVDGVKLGEFTTD